MPDSRTIPPGMTYVCDFDGKLRVRGADLSV